MPRRHLSVPEQHQLRIARRTLKLHDAAILILGGMSKAEAQAVIARLTGKVLGLENTRRERNV